MTQNRIYATKQVVGRNKEYPDRITLPLAEGVVDRIDAVRGDGETRLEVIREAIERELKRRERSKPTPK